MPLTTTLPRAVSDLFALPFSDWVLAKSLAASTAEEFTIPAGAEYVAFSANGDFYAKADGTATVPGDTTDGSASELNPTIRYIKGKSTISVIAPVAGTIVTASFYKSPTP